MAAYTRLRSHLAGPHAICPKPCVVPSLSCSCSSSLTRVSAASVFGAAAHVPLPSSISRGLAPRISKRSTPCCYAAPGPSPPAATAIAQAPAARNSTQDANNKPSADTLYEPRSNLAPYMGPLAMVATADSDGHPGVGMVATRAVQPGELLLLVPPLACVTIANQQGMDAEAVGNTSPEHQLMQQVAALLQHQLAGLQPGAGGAGGGEAGKPGAAEQQQQGQQQGGGSSSTDGWRIQWLLGLSAGVEPRVGGVAEGVQQQQWRLAHLQSLLAPLATGQLTAAAGQHSAAGTRAGANTSGATAGGGGAGGVPSWLQRVQQLVVASSTSNKPGGQQQQPAGGGGGGAQAATQQGEAAAAAAAAAAADAEAEKRQVAQAEVLESVASGLVSTNSYMAVSPDQAAAVIRHMPPEERHQGHMGIWPAFSLLNHSCVPTASYMTLGRTHHMVVRAARHIAAGEEVTVSYIGPRILQPLSARREYLQHSYGFKCCCPRCAVEESWGSDVQEAVQEMAQAAQFAHEAMRQALPVAAAAANADALTELQQQQQPSPLRPRDPEVLEAATDLLHARRRDMSHLVSHLGLGPSISGEGSATTSTSDVGHTGSPTWLRHLHWLQAAAYPVVAPTPVAEHDLCDVALPSHLAHYLSKAAAAGQLGSGPGAAAAAQGLPATSSSSSTGGGDDFAAAAAAVGGSPPPDLDAFQTALSVLGEVAPGSDLHIALAVQHLCCAERILGLDLLLAAAAATQQQQEEHQRQHQQEQAPGDDGQEGAAAAGPPRSGGSTEGLRWAAATLANVDRAVYDAFAARYGEVSQDKWEHLLWLNAAARLPPPLVRLVMALRAHRQQNPQQY